jgi:hypothetical protein
MCRAQQVRSWRQPLLSALVRAGLLSTWVREGAYPTALRWLSLNLRVPTVLPCHLTRNTFIMRHGKHLPMTPWALDIGVLRGQSCDKGNAVFCSLGWHI